VPFDANAGGIAVPLGGVLALDLSGIVGYAYGLLNERQPIFGTWILAKHQGEGARYVSFENELAKWMGIWKPAHVVLESALPLMAMAMSSTQSVAAQQFTLRGIAVMEAYRGRASRSEIDAMTVRREVIGRATFPKDRVKVEVVRACHKRGWKVPDHNAGDACLTWEWHRMRMAGVAPVAGPLWGAMA
jgi:Holliday junction resolvasome RuvABC endonuclease subunit